MMNNFKDVFLLDRNPPEILICAQCKNDQRIDIDKLHKSGWKTSDGTCIRHFTQLLKTAGIDDVSIKAAIDRVSAKYPGKAHPRDLSDPKNKPFLDWLRNPTPAPTLQKTQNPS